MLRRRTLTCALLAAALLALLGGSVAAAQEAHVLTVLAAQAAKAEAALQEA